MKCKRVRTKQEYRIRYTQPTVQWVPGFFPGVKRQERKVYHSPSSSAELKNEWSYTSIPPIYLYGVDMAEFALKDQEDSDYGLDKCQRFLERNQENNHGNLETCCAHFWTRNIKDAMTLRDKDRS